MQQAKDSLNCIALWADPLLQGHSQSESLQTVITTHLKNYLTCMQPLCTLASMRGIQAVGMRV